MKNMHKLNSSFYIAILFFLSIANANAGNCTIINASENEYYRVTGTMHHHTHIILPDAVIGTPFVGNKDLWTVFSEEGSRHIAFGPNNALEAGLSTTLSVVTESGNVYFFILERVPVLTEACVKVMEKSNPFSPTQGSVVSSLGAYKSKDRAASETKVANALSKYQQTIHSPYLFKQSGNPPSRLLSVWDDGRFTFIRFDTSRFGIPAFEGRKGSILEVQADDNSNTYKISGLHKNIKASFPNKSNWKITRR